MAKINLLNGENISTKNLRFDKEQFEELGLLIIRNLRPKFHYVNGEKTDAVECYLGEVLSKNTYDILLKNNISVETLKETTVKISLNSKNVQSILSDKVYIIELTDYSIVPKWNQNGWATCEILVDEFKVVNDNA